MYEEIKAKYPGLKASQIKAAYLMSMGKKQSIVAREIEVKDHTIWRWKKDPEFMALYNDFCESHLMGIAGMYVKARSKLSDLLDSEDIANKDLLTAIKIMNDEYHKISEKMDKMNGETSRDTDALDVLADVLGSRK